MKIVEFNTDFVTDPSFIKLTHEHIRLQEDKINFPEPEDFNYNWSDTNFVASDYAYKGILKGYVLVDDDSLVQGYCLFVPRRNMLTNLRLLYVFALIVSEKYRNSYWAGKLVSNTIKYAKSIDINNIEWSININSPGEELFYKHPNKFKRISQSFLQTI